MTSSHFGAALRPRAMLTSMVFALSVAFAGDLAASPTPPEAQPQHPLPRRDLYGDPLPAGALARIGTERLRHPYTRGIAFAADGKTLISAGQDQIVRFWDWTTGRLIRAQGVPRTQPVLALAPDGKSLALRGDEQLILWDISANKEIQRIPTGNFDFNTYVCTLRFSADGKTLAASNYASGEFRLWDLGSGKERGRYKENMGVIALSPDGKLLASGNVQRLALWDVAAGKQLRIIPGPTGKSGLPSFSPDGKLLAVDGSGAIVLYETATGKEIAVWQFELRRAEHFGHEGVAVSPDGKTVAARYDNFVALWDRTTRKEVKRLYGPRFGTGDIRAQLCFSPDGKQLAFLRTGAIVLWDVAAGKQVSERPGHFAAADSAAFSPDGKLLASAAGGDNTVRLWDAHTGKQLRVWSMPQSKIGPLFFSPDGTKVIAGGFFGDGRMWDVSSGEERCLFRLPDVPNRFASEMIPAMQLSADGKRLTAISLLRQNKGGVREQKRYLTVWDVSSGKRIERRALAFASGILPNRESFSPDGKLVATMEPRSGSRMMIYDVVTDRPLRTLPGLAPLAFSGDGKIIAYGGEFGDTQTPIQLLEVASGGNLLSLSAGEGWLRAFTRDGRYLVTVGERNLRLWELATGKEVLQRRISTLNHPSSYINLEFISCLALSPDGRSAVIGFQDTNLLIWDLAPTTRQQRKLSAADLERLWKELAGEDAPRAYSAAGTLIADAERSVPFLRDRLHPVKEDAPRIRRLITDLGSDQFPLRDAAFQELEKMDDAAHAVLRQELPKAASLEMRRRIQTLLTVPWVVRSPEKMRQVRAIAVLERIGNTAAQRVLEPLAEGATEARQTREAKAALQRLGSVR